MIRYLLDTDVFSQLTNPQPHANVAAWLAGVDDDALAISVLTVQERWKGVARATKDGKDQDGRFAAGLQSVIDAFQGRVVVLGPDAAKAWGLLVGAQDKKVFDKGQAAIAGVEGLTLVTRNVGDYKGLGVDVLDPFIAPAKLHPK